MLDKEIISKYRNDAQGLAKYFSDKYYHGHEKVFPLNPFQVLTDLGIHFVFRNFKNLEGLYMPATSETDVDLVAININRPITRQRFSAAHELCHVLKDADIKSPFMCAIAANDFIERYAESFASAFLMPEKEMREQIDQRNREGQLTLDDVLVISDYFGARFKACFYRIRTLFPYFVSHIDKKDLEKYKPDRKRTEYGLNYTGLYADLFDAWNDVASDISSAFALQVFKNRYVYNDARMEGVDTNSEAVAEIIEDLQNNRQLSIYCTDKYESYCHVAGHAVMYDYVFENAYKSTFSVYLLSTLNAKLFSCFPNPEYGGKTRQENVLVLGAKFETLDWRDVMPALIELNKAVDYLEKKHTFMKRSEIILEVIKIHHRITVIHPFSDGNGRTSRAFMNEMLIRYGMPPFYIKVEKKEEYYAALEIADKKGDFNKLFEYTMRALMQSHAELAG